MPIRDDGPILITGATGRIGGMVVDQLVEAGVPVRALTRDPARASLPAVVEVVGGDFMVPESLDEPLRDTSAVFLVWTLPYAAAPAAIERIARYAPRIVLLSAPYRTPHPFFQQPNPMATLHAAIEQLIADAALMSTVVRPGMFASNVLHWWAPAIRAGQPVRWPYAAVETAPVDDRDVAAVAARVLCRDSHVGCDYVLTGPQSLTQADQVRIIGAAVGREVAFEELSPEEFRDATAGLWPSQVVEMLLAAWAAAVGHPAYVTGAIADVLGRPAGRLHQWAVANAEAFT
jgi:uncharacterized protein YbjT (DUF2867 family)